MRRPLVVLLPGAAIALSLAAPASASARVATCAETAAPRVLLRDQGQLESVLVDRRGRLLFTDRVRNALLVVTRRGARPRVLTRGIADPGGLVEDARGRLLVGFGNNLTNSTAAPQRGGAGVYVVDPATGRKRVLATGFSMANGLARAGDGTLYGSSTLSASIDRLLPGRRGAQRAWAVPRSSNGLALRGRFLFANVSTPPTRIVRVDTRDPSRVVTWAVPPAADEAAFLDGLALARDGRLLATAWAAGEVWRSAARGRLCALARDLPNPSAVAVGRGGRGFRARDAYVVTYGGTVVELARAAG